MNKTIRQVDLIVNNFRKVLTTGNIQFLSKQTYEFIMNSSGFIAHYDLFGFRAEYEHTPQLAREIMQNRNNNLYLNFRPGDNYYDYMTQKALIYAKLIAVVEAVYV
jgi:hypothetical protein